MMIKNMNIKNMTLLKNVDKEYEYKEYDVAKE